MYFAGTLTVGGWGVVDWDRKSYLGPAEIASFSSRNFSRSNKHETFWHVVSTGYFNVSFSWAIAVSDFRPLGIHKNLGLSTITFTVNNHADNHFHKYIYLLHIQYEISHFIKIDVKLLTKVFYSQIWFKCETPSYSF